MSLPASLAQIFGGGRRSSRVAVTAGRYDHAEPLVPPDLASLPSAPDAVLMAGTPTRWGLQLPAGLVVVDLQGTHAFEGNGRWLGALEDDGATRLGNRVWPADGSERQLLRPIGRFVEPAVQLAASWHDELWITALQRTAPFAPPQLVVEVRANGSRLDDEAAPRWCFVWPRRGTAAIADDGTVAIATEDHALHILAAPTDPACRDPEVVAQLELPYEPYGLSATDDGFLVCSAIDGDVTAAVALRRRLGLRPHGIPAAWRTEVRSLDRRGDTRWAAVLDMTVWQPPIDGGGDRVLLAGRGLACIEGGAVQWTRALGSELYATAFADGSAAVGVGAHVGVVDRVGTMVQGFAIPEVVVTPPSIGRDGALAVGTQGRTYLVPVIHD